MNHFFRNDKFLVIPGMESAQWGQFAVTPEYYETPYGLVLPTTGRSLGMIRYLRNFDPSIKESLEYAQAEHMTFFAYLLNNKGELEIVQADTKTHTDGVIYHSLEVVSLPDVTSRWTVYNIAEYMKAAAMSDIVADMSMQDAAAWIDANSSDRFQQPIPISIDNWIEYRTDKELSKKFLPNHAFVRKINAPTKKKD